jgi:hypothetical protein
VNTVDESMSGGLVQNKTTIGNQAQSMECIFYILIIDSKQSHAIFVKIELGRGMRRELQIVMFQPGLASKPWLWPGF